MEEQNEQDLAESRERMRKALEHVLSQVDETTHLMLVTIRGTPDDAMLSQHMVGLDPTSIAYLFAHVMATEFGIVPKGESIEL